MRKLITILFIACSLHSIAQINIGVIAGTRSRASSGGTTNVPINITPDAPLLFADDVANTLTASHALGTSEIEMSINDDAYIAYSPINVGDVARVAGYYKFRTRAATNRNVSPVALSPSFTVAPITPPVNTTPASPTIVADDNANTIYATHPLGTSEILISTNNAGYVQYDGATINVGNVARSAGYYKFKTKAATGRNESPVSSSPAFTVATSTAGTFTLATAATTSAGIYKQDGTLARTLWSGVYMGAGTYPIKWDGTDDYLQSLPVDNYNVKVVSSNVQYTWQGTIGNSSSNITGANVIHRSLDPVSNMVIVGSNAYYAVGYDEATPSMFGFALATPQVKQNLFDGYGNQITDYACTDGTNIYWTCWDSYDIPANYDGGVSKPAPTGQEQSFVFATKISDNTLLSFSGGASKFITYGKSYASVIDYKATHAKPSGIAVSGSYLFVSYAASNAIDVLNKSTGALVRTITLTNPTCMAVDGGNIWIATGTNTLQKYPINSDGSIGTGSTAITGLSSPVDVRVNGTTLAVVDAGTNQQVKTFNTGTGVAIWTLGQSGGNLVSPLVSNDRFGFWFIDEQTGIKQNRGGFAFAPDGSFWVADPSNKRMIHFDANRTYIESIVYQGKTYTCYVDPNNHTRVIANLQEFQVGYASTSPIQNAWIAHYNWEGTFNSGYDVMDGIRDITTLSNGRTYSLIIKKSTGEFELVELTSTGIRYTGILFPGGNTLKMYPDGSIYTVQGNGLNETEIWQKKTLTSFDGAGNPTYSGFTTVLTNNVTDMAQPRLSGAKVLPWEITASNILVNFRGNKEGYTETPGSYHLGGMNPATGQWLWKTSMSTYTPYMGEYPSEGTFDIGNGPPQYEGNVAMAIDRNIFWGYNGEFWKQSQVNKWNHYYDNGLFIGQFGKTGPEYNQDPVANAAFAGNSFSPAIIKEGSDYFMYHNDESVHGGILRWKITGLNTIQEQVVPITTSFVRTSEKPALSAVDMMAGLPYLGTLTDNTAGWNISPAVSAPNWTAKTNLLTYNKRNSPDLYATYYPTSTGTNIISRTLGSNSNLSAWTITGKVTYNNCMPNSPDGAGLNQYLDVLDNTGKIIVRFYQKITFGTNPPIHTLYANNTQLMTGPEPAIKAITTKFQPLTIAKSGTSIVVTYAGQSVSLSSTYDAGAAMGNPTTFRLHFSNVGGVLFEKFIGISDFMFNNNPQIQ